MKNMVSRGPYRERQGTIISEQLNEDSNRVKEKNIKGASEIRERKKRYRNPLEGQVIKENEEI